MNKHSPGPWSFEAKPISEDNPTMFGTVTSADGKDVVYVTLTNGDVKANTRLIAAAPQMADALQAMMRGSEYRTTTLGDITLTGWATIRMPDENALNLARAALVAAGLALEGGE
jgi:hypothetical protein